MMVIDISLLAGTDTCTQEQEISTRSKNTCEYVML